jgi:hypothetical protein
LAKPEILKSSTRAQNSIVPFRNTYIRVFLAMELGDLVLWLEILTDIAAVNLIEEVSM